MWLIDRHGDGLEQTRIEIPGALSQTLRLWYDGSGTDADEEASIILVQQARRSRKWIACSCQGQGEKPPLMSPAFLAIADTYYLRRLTGRGRARHRTDCPYFREQAPPRIRERLTSATHRSPTDGYFEVLKPIPEHLAQAPNSTAPDDRTRGASVPRLARLIWELLDAAKRNVILPIASTEQKSRSITGEFAAIRAASKRIFVAPGIALSDVLYTHADAFLKGHVFGHLKFLERHWPGGHAPQAFLILYTQSVRGNTLHLADGRTMTTTSRVLSPSTRARAIHGPFLTLVVVGKHPDDQRYNAIGAYAQPIHSGMRFLPVKSDDDRILIKALDAARWRLHLRGLNVRVVFPLFDAPIANEFIRPDFVIDTFDRLTGELQTLVIDEAHAADGSVSDASLRRRELLEMIGTVVSRTPNFAENIDEILNIALFPGGGDGN
ncbi:hypothetical protein [Sphingomonas sp. SUN039]|uniref:hypothetical protein n=1 Tax=Sphingomonas sp. SUN039 TaxID=2937787 RepID=UPI0021645114|nr:hypothetical protein [Sphingomonas sp. SUN039]UVO53785.1 hypothetical protein M0209_06480 [Sphingomonas sp. SUN039]